MDKVKWVFVDMWHNHSATFVKKEDALQYATRYMEQMAHEWFGLGECILAQITHKSVLYGESENRLMFMMNYVGDDDE